MARKDFKGGFDSLLQGVRQTPTEEEIEQQSPNEAVTVADHEQAPARNMTKAGNIRATFIVEAGLLAKIKALSYRTRTQQKEIINAAIREYLERYEETNGEIKPL